MWKPPAYGLVQEQYWPDGWKILVCCLCLNLTTRKQMEPVVAEIFRRWPTPESLAAALDSELADVIRPLGMWKKRTVTLKKMSQQFAAGEWADVRELHGVGKYASDAYRIFILGEWRSVEPKDHALTDYHNYLRENYA